MSIKSSTNSKADRLGVHLREKFGDRLVENWSLGQYVRTRVGGVVEYLVEARSVDDIVAACQIAAEADRPYAVIGGGTGTLVSHVGALGLVIINATDRIYFSQDNSLVIVESGVSNHTLVTSAASRGLGGLEFLIGIPGTIGGAFFTRASYLQRSLGSFVRLVSLWVESGGKGQVISTSALEAEQILNQRHKCPPVILTLHIQFSRLYPEEIVRRISRYQHRVRQITAAGSVIGTPFSPHVESQPVLYRALERLRENGLRFNPSEGIVTSAKSGIQPLSYRSFIRRLSDIAEEQGATLDDRLTYLGYWPDEGEDAAL